MAHNTVIFKGINRHIGQDQLSNILESNLKTYYDWSLLNIGGWTDVTIPATGIYGADFSSLRLVDDPNYTLGQVWEGFRKDWVWESGVNYVDTVGATGNPTSVSTPKVDGIDTASSYYVNYPLGRIIFDTAISTTAKVQMQYPYRTVQIYRADNAEWWHELQYQSHRADSSQFTQTGSGDWSILGHNRVQLPAIIVETVARGSSRGFELGSHSLDISRDVMFHIVTETRKDRNDLMDIISLQTDKDIWLFNTNSLVASGDYPIDFKGEKIGNNMYTDFIASSGHRWQVCRFEDAVISEIQQIHPNLYEGVVRTTMKIII